MRVYNPDYNSNYCQLSQRIPKDSMDLIARSYCSWVHGYVSCGHAYGSVVISSVSREGGKYIPIIGGEKNEELVVLK